MKTYIVVYDTFAQFEVVLSSYFLKEAGEIVTVGVTDEPALAYEGFRTLPDMRIEDVNASDVDVLILPGGNPEKLYDCNALYGLIRAVNERGKIIGAICSSPLHLGKAGILKGRKYTVTPYHKGNEMLEPENYIHQNTVIDGNIITAQPSGYVDFAIDIGKMAGIYKDEADLQETIDFFREFKILEE